MAYTEDIQSKYPALELLEDLGYEIISPQEGEKLRGNNLYDVILKPILRRKLKEINKIDYLGTNYEFSDRNIDQAIKDIDVGLDIGLISANEKIYHMLMMGNSYEEIMENGNRRSFPIKYIDWVNINNNEFSVIEEFRVAREDGKKDNEEGTDGQGNIRPDLVLFINGIPMAVIEAKRPSIDIKQGISQMIRNQRDEYIPHLFKYIQMLMVINSHSVKYATVGTPERFWSIWSEDDEKSLNKMLEKHIKEREVTKQDKDIISLFSKERFIEIIKYFLVYDNNVKKVARYQQYFGVKGIMERVRHIDENNRRGSGVIWHTQGSGKSLTMVMASKYILEEFQEFNPKILIVTDRINLDKQIHKTFLDTDQRVTMARTGKHLRELINDDGADIITSIIDKFNTAAKYQDPVEARDIFILVDESHRSQYGRMHNRMRRVFPNASYIGFTGTPLMRKEKSTVSKFGDFIHTYTINQAVEDKTILPLLYEGLLVDQEINKSALDAHFKRITRNLNEKEIEDLKAKWSKFENLASSDQRIMIIVDEISTHFVKNFQNTGFNAMLATSRKKDAVRYFNHFESDGRIKSAVIISPPDDREGYDDIEDEIDDEVLKFWNKMMKKYGGSEDYETYIKNSFIDGEIELLIVVDKLLTGFDAPRATVMYIDKSLKEHNLLQAIARVNRLFEGKDYGYVIDYRGLLNELNSAMDVYSGAGLENFDSKDLKGALYDVIEVLGKLRESYSNLENIFRNIKNKNDLTSCGDILEDEELRDDFYQALRSFSKYLKIAFSSNEVYISLNKDEEEKYRERMKFFRELREVVRLRYSDGIKFGEYEGEMQKMMDMHIVANSQVEKLVEPVDITDRVGIERELKRMGKSPKAEADLIRTRLTRRISKNWDRDPRYYKKLSELINDILQDYRDKRITEAEMLEKTIEVAKMETEEKPLGEYPERIRNNSDARAFYGKVYEEFNMLREEESIYIVKEEDEDFKGLMAVLAERIDKIIEDNRKVDWYDNQSVLNNIAQELDDLFYEFADEYGLELTLKQQDKIIDEIKAIAQNRY